MRSLIAFLCFLLPISAAADSYYPTPHGHVELLARRPTLAFDRWSAWPVDMGLLRRVNRAVNAAITYRPEGKDVWGSGADCEDYALRKLALLLKAGVPRGALRLAVARVGGRGHAVLVVRDLWVIDSLRDDLVRLNRAALRLDA